MFWSAFVALLLYIMRYVLFVFFFFFLFFNFMDLKWSEKRANGQNCIFNNLHTSLIFVPLDASKHI